MKEKLFKFLKIIGKILKLILLFLCGILIIAIIYSLIFEQNKIAIDKYNFQQLEKIKEIINNDEDFENVSFPNLYNFNYIYKTDIQPIKNCYFFVTTDKYKNYKDYIPKYNYIIGFKLESIIYKIKYLTPFYYVYPKYDIPPRYIPGFEDNDDNFSLFIQTIMKPCD